jgi:uncharacterized lipoprotein
MNTTHSQCSFVVTFLLLLISACALSPHQVSIRPEIRLESPAPLGIGHSIALDVADGRTGPVVGTRGGVYAGTSEISTAGDIRQPIRAELEKAFTTLGFEVRPAGDAADATLRVVIESIEYHAHGANVVREIETAATVRADAAKGTRTFSGRYQGSSKKDVLTAPDAADNEQLINAAVSRMLQRVAADRELLNFLTR